MTDLDGRAERLCELYARRMSVEGLFRDGESRRDGQSLRHTRIGSPDRFDRFLLVVALAYILLAGLGLAARLDHGPSAWCTNRRARERVQRPHHRQGGIRAYQVLTLSPVTDDPAGDDRGRIEVGMIQGCVLLSGAIGSGGYPLTTSPQP